MAALVHGRDRLGDFGRGFRRAVDVGGMIDQPRDDAGLVADLVQVAEALPIAACGICPISASTGAFMP